MLFRAFVSALALVCSTPIAFAADSDRLTVEQLFRLPQYAAMKISPDGKHLAALAPVGKRQNLVLLDLDERKASPVTGLSDRDVVDFDWVNSQRLILTTGTLGTQEDNYRGGGLWAVDRDGKNVRQIGEGIDEVNYIRVGVARFVDQYWLLPGEGEDIIIQEAVYESGGGRKSGSLFRVNSRTGRRVGLSFGVPENAEQEGYVLDSKGTPRIFVASGDGKTRIFHRASAEAPWQKLAERATFAQGWLPLAFDEDDKTLFVSANEGSDKRAIHKFDFDKNQPGELVARHPQVDLENLRRFRARVAGVAFNADRVGFAWFDERIARLQAMVDKALPDTVNVLSWSENLERVVIRASADTAPGTFYLLDTKTNKLEWLVDAMPWLKDLKLAAMQPVRYAARDGLEIPAYLTLPNGSKGKNLPLVVLVHGGPWVDGDSWGYDPEVQFLASRGYAVLQPNFRGTTRYGRKHFESSFKQWGLAMQDDLTDGVLWAVKEGIVDPQRVCIMGASYGGYAAMMGVIRDPDLYRCAVNYVGVTDINRMYNVTWSDFAYSSFIAYDAKKMLGDPEKDAARLKAASAVENADKIKVPVLMAYGAADRRVPLVHGEKMKAALDKHGKKYEWMVFAGEGHGFREPENQKKFYGATERFLAEHLAPRQP